MRNARHTGGPTFVTNAYPVHSKTVRTLAAVSPNRNRRITQNTTNARMLTFIPDTTRMWYVPDR